MRRSNRGGTSEKPKPGEDDQGREKARVQCSDRQSGRACSFLAARSCSVVTSASSRRGHNILSQGARWKVSTESLISRSLRGLTEQSLIKSKRSPPAARARGNESGAAPLRAGT